MIVRKHNRSLDELKICLDDMRAVTGRPRDVVLRSLEYVYAELHLCASLSCATAGTVETLRHGEAWSPGALRALLPPAPSAFPAVIDCLLEDADFHDLCETLREHYSLQGTARGLTEMCDSVADGCSPAAAFLVQIAGAWQEVATIALRAFKEIHRTLPHSRHASRAKQICEVLERVRSGDRFDPADCGLSHLPGTGEKRLVARANVSTYVLIERGTSLQKVLVTDVSRRGLGLEGPSDAVPNEVMRILWKPGAVLLTRVSWVNANRFGLELVEQTALAEDFIRSLIESDPLPTRH